MKDRTSKQCSFKEMHCSFLIRMHFFFFPAISLSLGSGIGFGICCIIIIFFVFMRVKAEALPLLLEELKTYSIRYISSHSLYVNLNCRFNRECLTSALTCNMQSICQIYIYCRFETNTLQKSEGGIQQLIPSRD